MRYGLSFLIAANIFGDTKFRVSVRVELDLTGAKTQHTEGEGADVMWQSKFEREYDMAFLRFVDYYFLQLIFFSGKKRFRIWHNEFAARDDHIVVFCARLNHIVKDKWALVRMMDMKGKSSGATFPIRFSFLSPVKYLMELFEVRSMRKEDLSYI